MNNQSNILLLTPIDNKLSVYQEFKYKDITVPKEFKCNGMDLKIFIFKLFINKYQPNCLKAVVVHDYLCSIEEYEKADKYMEELLPNIWQKRYIVKLVKSYHEVRYGVKQ